MSSSPEQFVPNKRDTDLITGLVVNSFRFSRGQGEFQSAMLTYIGKYYEDRLSVESLDAAEEAAVQACHRIRTNPSLHVRITNKRLERTGGEVGTYLGNLEAGLEGDSPDLLELTRAAVKADLEWITPLRRFDAKMPPSHRTYYSNVMKHGVVGQQTGNVAFDAMFADVARTLPEYLTSDAPVYNVWPPHFQLGQIALGHLRVHPETEEPIRAAMDDLGVRLPQHSMLDN